MLESLGAGINAGQHEGGDCGTTAGAAWRTARNDYAPIRAGARKSAGRGDDLVGFGDVGVYALGEVGIEFCGVFVDERF